MKFGENQQQSVESDTSYDALCLTY